MKTLSILAIACLSASALPAFAQPDESQSSGPPVVVQPAEQQQTTVVTPSAKPSGAAAGAVTGAVAGAVVAGPVGAVVGAVAGAVVGSSVAPPGEVRTYVTTQNATTVAYGQPIAMGRTVDGEVVWMNVPSHPKYSWAYLNGQRIVVDSDTHRVVAIY